MRELLINRSENWGSTFNEVVSSVWEFFSSAIYVIIKAIPNPTISENGMDKDGMMCL